MKCFLEHRLFFLPIKVVIERYVLIERYKTPAHSYFSYFGAFSRVFF